MLKKIFLSLLVVCLDIFALDSVFSCLSYPDGIIAMLGLFGAVAVLFGNVIFVKNCLIGEE